MSVHRTGRPALAALLLLASLPYGPPAAATTLRALPLEELVARAEVVARGTVGAVVTTRDARGRIVRDVSFSVAQYIVGEGPDALTVRLLGGELDGEGTRVDGEAALIPGEQRLLFLERLPGKGRPRHRVVGMAQGSFALSDDPATGLALVSREIGPLRGSAAAGREPDLARGESCYCTTLARFEALIRALARSPRPNAAE